MQDKTLLFSATLNANLPNPLRDSLNELEKKLNNMRFLCSEVTSVFTVVNVLIEKASLSDCVNSLLASGHLMFVSTSAPSKRSDCSLKVNVSSSAPFGADNFVTAGALASPALASVVK